MRQFSSIMFDASALPLSKNIVATRDFVDRHGRTIIIEGACDQIGHSEEPVTDPGTVEKYWRESGVDLVVANLGTEHRAGASALSYGGELARAMAARVGARLVLHGTSSVKPECLRGLAADGICKANIWTALERDSAPALLEAMTRHAAKITGSSRARMLQQEGLLGDGADFLSNPSLDFFATSWRQQIVFEEMRRIAAVYLEAWFPPGKA
jgi:fructose-bisphosphate aldolase class II